jgi:hypothetical protein
VRAGDQRVEIGQSAESRIDIAVIGDVIAIIGHRAGEEGGNPDRIDAEPGNVIEMGGDARKIPDPVAVAVGKAARIDLVDGGAAPPFYGVVPVGSFKVRRLVHRSASQIT